MIIKSSTFLYLFGFDETIVSKKGVNLYGLFSSNKKLFFNPDKYDIRWCLISDRPKKDKFLIWIICKIFNLHPLHIFTSKKFFKKDNNFKLKENIIKSVLDRKIKIKSFVKSVEKVVYIDNDFQTIQYLNNVKQNYNYVAISVADFLKKDFIFIITS